MVSSINLGGMLSQDNSVKGLVSGLDSEALINASIEAKKLPVKKLEEKIQFNTEKVAAFADLENKFKNLQNSANSLRAVPGYQGETKDLLSAKQVFLTSTTADSATNYISVIASNSLSAGSFDIEVDKIAKAKTEQTTSFSAKDTDIVQASGDHSDTSLFTAGTFQINGIDITLSAGDKLIDIESRINSFSSQTNVSATIIEPTSGTYKLLLQSNETGVSNAYTVTDTNNVFNNILSGGSTVQTAQDAQFTYNGITVTRSSNTISDYTEGLTIKLHKETTGTDKITVDIDYDPQGALKAIGDFAHQYNEFVKFAAKQQARDGEGNWAESAKIRNNSLLSNSVNNLSSTISGTALGSNLNYKQLADIGIKFTDQAADVSTGEPLYRNLLTIDESKFKEALNTNFSDVRKLFEFQYESTSSDFTVTDRSNSLTETSFSIDVDINRASNEIAQITYGATTINATFEAFDDSDLTKGGRIKGADGTIFEGFEFQYVGAGVSTANFTASQGIGDKVYNVLDSILEVKHKRNASDSTATLTDIDLEIVNLTDENLGKANEIERKNDYIEKYRLTLVNKYAALEAAIAQANSMLQFLDATMKAMENK